jgi:DNA repair exonuclease SbcCD ATPase subunit
MNQRHKLTGLEIGEVSFVDKGAIGEVFSIIKMEDPDNPNQTVLKEFEANQICENLSKMTDNDFVGVMNNMMSRYHEINKGGNEMNEEQIKEIVKAAMGEVMESVNKNFASINKSIDEIQKAASAEADAKAKEEEEKKKKAQEEEVGAVKKSLEDVTKSIGEINTALDAVAKMKEAVDGIAKINETLADVSKRLENVEKMENPSNSVKTTDVNKSAGTGEKTVFWKSILGVPEQE